ncbi:MAG TPA: NAD(P)-dependent alcohol dehydrogenase [Acidimicrobiia bacterium]
MESPDHRIVAAPRTETMTAAIQNGYGEAHEVIDISEVPVPTTAPDRVLVRVAAASINALDWHYMTGTPRFARLDFGLTSPKRKIPGADISGTVVAIGDEVTDLRVGDEVFGDIGGGGFAEYASAKASRLAPKPTNLSLEESSTLGVAALTALQGLRDWGSLQPGQTVLINGASGGVGTFAVQVAKALGAGHVTGVCSTGNVETALKLGADRVIDYTRDDFTSLEDRFDVFFDNAGSKSLGQSRRMLRDNGVFVMVTGQKGGWIRPADRMFAGAIRSRFWSQRFISRTARAERSDLLVLKDMVEAGQVKPVMDRRFSLNESVDALAYQAEGHARGKSVVVP